MGLSVPLFGEAQIVDKSSNFTADKYPSVYVVTTTGGSVTATLPAASGLKGLVLSFHLEATTYPNTLTIDGNSSETIDGATTLVLYVNQDLVTIVCDGDEWHTLVDKRRAHTCKLRRDAAQTINTGTMTKIAFDAEEVDIGGIGDIATNDRFDIRRTGTYLVVASWACYGLDDAEYGQVYLRKNGTDVDYGESHSSLAAAYNLPQVCRTLSLTAGDYLEMYVYHIEGASVNTQTLEYDRPRMTVSEII